MMLFLTLWTSALIYLAYGEDDYDLYRKAMENPDLFGGDMLVDMDADRNFHPSPLKRWRSATVPYIIDSSLKEYEDLIKKAFKHYESKTCVKFEPRRPEQKNFIRLFEGNGCYSQVGMGGGQQVLSLGEGCRNIGTVIHELGHALGLWHEQSRSDRDDYLDIFLENVAEGAEHNFMKLHPMANLLLVPFDYDSIMIYGNYAFSKDGSSMTMRAKNGHELHNSYDKEGLTDLDVKRLNKIYCNPRVGLDYD